MFIINLLVVIIFFYLLIYGMYLLTLNLKSFGAKKYIEYEGENFARNRFCVIVWVKNNDKNPLNILEKLKEQTYPSELYEAHMIATRALNNFHKLPDFASGIRIHKIENPDYYSKDRSISLFVSKILENTEKTFDGFVFLDSERIIENDFLENVNRAFDQENIISGSLDIKKENKTLLDKMLSYVLHSKLKYTNNTLNTSRTMFSLISIMDGGCSVIPSHVLEKTGRVCFETKDDELKYTLFLASNKIKTYYSPYVKTKIEPSLFNAASPHLSQKIMLFRYYFPILFKKPWYFVELILSILRPNVVFTILLYSILFYFSFRYMLNLKSVVHLGFFLVFNVFIGIISSRLNIKELLAIPFYPLCITVLKYEIFAKQLTKKTIEQEALEDEQIHSATIKSCVGNGQKSVPCKLDLVSEDGMRKVVFRYKRKRLLSDSHLRMFDALRDLIIRLKDKGLTLKVCENCEYYNPQIDGTVDLLKGVCKAHQRADGTYEQVLIWSGCTGFLEKKDNGIINIDETKS